jgi:glycine/D-amino acid oxidase-like deaminating enzyme
MSTPSYLILGSGVFGASTALHLIRAHPSASVTLVDRDHYAAATRVAASWDWNKVVRADYTDLTYTKLALEAQALWRSDAVFKPFYHESGAVWICASNFPRQVVKNHAKLGVVDADLRICSVDEAKGLYGGLFAAANYTGIKEVLVNRRSGWAEAKEVLARTIEEAVRLGVRYVAGEVTALRFEGGNSGGTQCIGVSTADGSKIDAGKVILCTGAYTPKLLVDSAPGMKELHAGGRILACAVTEAVAPLKEDGRNLLANMPVGSSDNPVERGTYRRVRSHTAWSC